VDGAKIVDMLNRIVKEDGAPAPAAYDEISPWRGRLN
jgi:hypothetical protein